jgi:hypothetical protein
MNMATAPEIEVDEDTLRLRWAGDGESFTIVIENGRALAVSCKLDPASALIPWSIALPDGLIRVDESAVVS